MTKKLFLILLLIVTSLIVKAQVHTSYLWHLHQPNYWGDVSKKYPNRCQLVVESEQLKLSGGNNDVNGLAHPTNKLQEIFGNNDRVNAYQHGTKNSINSIKDLPEAGAQLTYGGSLMESVNDLGKVNQWGYYPAWADNIKTGKSWQTIGGFPRMEVVSFTMHHALSPLMSDQALKKQIQAHQFYSKQLFGTHDSKGYWPAECSFSERIIKTLTECGIEWSVIANSHLARTLSDYPIKPGSGGSMADYPNKADQVEIKGETWFSAQKDARGGQFAVPYCYMPYKAKYIDPETAQEYKITVVPMADYESYLDGYAPIGLADISPIVAKKDVSPRPPLVLLAHDGDNAWGGGDAYYNQSVTGFSHAAANAGHVPTTIPQYLKDHPVPDDAVAHIEDGSWVNADGDFGHPQFTNWLWPFYNAGTYTFNPNAWTEDMMNQCINVAGEHHAIMAEELEGNNLRISEIVNPTSAISPAEKAWHFMMPSYDSGNAYYGDAEDFEVKTTLATNLAIKFSKPTFDANTGKDTTKPSVFIPQRWPYNPGEKGFGAPYAYKEFLNSADFTVYTFAYDYSGIAKAELKYRLDNDGKNNMATNHNEIYAGGTDVAAWKTLTMNSRIFPKGNITNNPKIDLYMLPDAIGTQYHAEIAGISEKLVDYYVEITDAKGNVSKSKIQHVWVGKNLNVAPKIAFEPAVTFSPNPIDVKITATDSNDPAPKVYYTTDGSTPTTSSPSFVSTKTINITSTTTFNVLAIDNEGNQSTSSQKYTVGDVPTITMYFKPPTTPTGSWVGAIPKIHAWKVVNGVTTNITGAWPGIAMTSAGNGWFKYTVQNETNINVIFNNGQNGIGTNQTGNLEGITSDKWYDWDKKDFVLSVEDDNVSGTEFSISPNPTTGKITIKSIEELDVFGVYNLNGELIKNGKIIDNQIDISTLPSNIYYIKCLNKAEKVYLKKIIKK